ncbi:Helicase associated domain protein [Streptacidiphilus sp. EB103A]|uniref:DEAD/DEAH box helicase n=1 Tax=Streptacidiphilus sp. EB103A TaxID=3156275 RepID=UPI003514E85C
MPVKLRDHQVEAVDAIVRGLDIPPGKKIPPNGLRAQVHSPCGSGKTITAAAASLRLVPHGRVLVMVPTLDLLTQTVRAWREVGHTGPAVAVCGLQDDTELFDLDVRCTTSPPQLALWHSTGPVLMFATYSSLGVLAEAFEGVYGQKLTPLDLAVVDEAHRTSGSLGKAWAEIHDQNTIPSTRRLYLTATPRIWMERPLPAWEPREGNRHERLPEEMAASMTDEKIFGPVIYKMTLAQGVQRGLLARYQIIVVELADPVVTPERLMRTERTQEQLRGERMGALQAAMLHTAAKHGLQTMITFHHRTVEAQAFAEGLGAVAAQLYATDPEKYPSKIWANWLQGEHSAERRRKVLGEFGRSARRAVLSNCRVLGEGVDIRAVDSVALLDPKGAPHDIVQAIGRALRQTPGEGKLASLIVPVFLGPGERPEDMFTSGSYKPLVAVLRALRSFDEEAVELLAIPQAEQTRSVNPSWDIGPAPEPGQPENRLLLRFATQRDPKMVADWVSFNVIDTERLDWARGYNAAQQFQKREGHMRVVFDHKEGNYPLGHWTSEQRKTYAAGQMTGLRVKQLDGLGMIWDAGQYAWTENLAAARAYFADHQTLAAPRSATALDRPVGQWLSNQRRPGALAGQPEREAALAEIDPDWNPTWPLEWQRHYAGVRECLQELGAELVDLEPGVTIHGHDIGRWLQRQRQPVVWHALTDRQRERLTALGVEPHAAPVAPERPGPKGPAKGPGSRSTAFTRGLAALQQYKERTGSLVVPRTHTEEVEDVTVKLGVWISNTKSRRDKLTPEQLAALKELGVHWC